MEIELIVKPKKKPAPSELGFGKYFTDYMLVMDYADSNWGPPRIVPYSPLKLDPSTSVLHYGQGIFEGLKAYKDEKGTIRLFRPRDNFERMNRGADRMCMPPIDIDLVLESLKQLLLLEEEWIPSDPGTSLYIRPTYIATDELLGVHPSSNYKFFIILSPVGAYYAHGLKPTKILIEEEFVRAPLGGTGEVKCMGNYAASLYAAFLAEKKGYEQVLWLDAREKKYVEEVGAMNMFFVIDGVVKTPKLTGSILPGITRDSVIKILKEKNIPIEETRISIDEISKAYSDGTLEEAFGSGTAAVISPVGVLRLHNQDLIINNNKMGKITEMLFDEITGIQIGKHVDKYGWVQRIK